MKFIYFTKLADDVVSGTKTLVDVKNTLRNQYEGWYSEYYVPRLNKDLTTKKVVDTLATQMVFNKRFESICSDFLVEFKTIDGAIDKAIKDATAESHKLKDALKVSPLEYIKLLEDLLIRYLDINIMLNNGSVKILSEMLSFVKNNYSFITATKGQKQRLRTVADMMNKWFDDRIKEVNKAIDKINSTLDKIKSKLNEIK